MTGPHLAYRSDKSCADTGGSERQKCDISVLLSPLSDSAINTDRLD